MTPRRLPALPKPRRLLAGLVLLGLTAGALWPTAAALLWSLPAALVAAVVAADMIRGLLRRQLGVDLIALLAILAALALGEFLTAAIIALMVAGGGALEEYAAARARRELTALLARTPRLAHRRDGAQVTDIPVEAIAAGDLLLVKPGETLPVDGILAEQQATLDEAALTGEPMPQTHAQGEPVRSGVVNLGGPFALRATATAAASTYAAVVRLVQSAEAERPPLVRLADRWALVFLAATLLLGGAAWWLAGDPNRALAVLVVATPCPMILAAPIALICGVSRAASRGIIVKGGGALERLARVRTMLFDKTGTLTSGTPHVTWVEAAEGFDPDTVLRLAASLAQVSQHVVARAIAAAAAALDLKLALPGAAREIAGGGLAGTVEGVDIMLGSAFLLDSANLPPPTEGPLARMAAAAAAVAWVALDGTVAGALLLADRIRPDTPRALRALRDAGVRRLVMLSGDRPASAEAVGAALGLDAVHADLSPEGKIALVRAERAHGPVAMVGDGINDAPALAAADIGIAMGARGAAAAAEAADIVLLVDRLDRVAEAVTAARRARGIAVQSIAAGMALSLLAMLVAAAGYLPPIAGALLQEAIDIAVILNALRVLRGAALPAPIGDRTVVDRLVSEHAQLRALLDRMRRGADRLDQPGHDAAELRAINAALGELLLPHQRDEEHRLFPELARRLGGRDPLGALSRMHEEIAQLATRYTALVDGLAREVISDGERRELRRLLYALDALVGLHLSAEEEMLSHVEDLPHAP